MQALSILALSSVVGPAAAMPFLSPWSPTMKSYRPWNVEQSYLLPPSPSDWLPEGHLAYFILDVVKMLDLGAITRVIDAKDARGERPYSPFMMTALLHNPDFTRISEFRRRHLAAFHDIFRQTVELCQKVGPTRASSKGRSRRSSSALKKPTAPTTPASEKDSATRTSRRSYGRATGAQRCDR